MVRFWRVGLAFCPTAHPRLQWPWVRMRHRGGNVLRDQAFSERLRASPLNPMESGGGRGLERRQVVPDDVAARGAILPLATQGLPQPWDTGVGLHPSRPPHVGEGRARSPTRARGAGPDRCVGRRRAVLPAIAMPTGRIALAARARQPQPRGRCGGHEAVECRHPKVGAGLEGAPEGGILEMAGLHAWGHAPCERRRRETRRDEVALGVEKTQTVEPHGFHGLAGGHPPPGWVLLGGAINDCREAEFCTHARDQTQVLAALGAVRLRLGWDSRARRMSHTLLLGRGIVAAPKNDSMTRAWCGIAVTGVYSTLASQGAIRRKN